MMNKSHVLQLADAIENGLPGVTFSMREWNKETPLGTFAGIGGYAEILSGDGAYKWLGLTEGDASALFLPELSAPWAWNATPAEAAKVLRHMAETGVCDSSIWDIIKPADLVEVA